MMRYFILILILMLPIWGAEGPSCALAPEVGHLAGIDISHHQKRIEWDSVATKHQIDFAFVKATEGADFSDSLFCFNWENLHRLGIKRGAYHFFRAYGCGDQQAEHFLSSVELKPGDMAPVLDVELTDGVAPELWREEMRVWLQRVEQKLGVKPIIYTNQNFYDRFLSGHFDDHPLWIARYADTPPLLENGMPWAIWQHSNEGRIEGIAGTVDLNILPGNEATLEKFCWYPVSAMP